MNKAVNLLQQYISNGQLDKALIESKKFCEQSPSDLYLKKLLSHVYYLKENFRSAIEISEEIIKEYPNDFDCHNNLGNYYLKLEEYEKSKEFISKSKEINKEHPAPYQNQSEIYIKERDFLNALKEINICISLHEKLSDDYLNYKSTIVLKIEIFIALKKQNEAVTLIKKYLSNKFDAELILHLIQIDKSQVENYMLSICKENSLNKTFNSSLEKYQKLVPVYFALANFYEKEDKELSEEYYIKANKEVFSIQRLTMMKFQKSILNIIKNYESIKEGTIADKLKGKNNIFVIGMPRSGTTLTESIISANSEVFGAGELMSFYDLTYKLMTDHEEFENKHLESVGDRYVLRTKYFLSNYMKVVDKLPNNYHFIGHIRKFLPSSKIILILRDPWDLAVSLFKQRYVSNISYSSSFFNLGVQISNFEACLLYWKSQGVIDDSIMTIRYEDLVQNFEYYQEKIYKFCEIQSEYKKEKRERFFAKTASINQVQNKIHTESLKKKDFLSSKEEFTDAFYSQREFWKSKNIIEIPTDFFGYNV